MFTKCRRAAKRNTWFLAIAGLMFGSAVAQEIYKSTDAQGHTIYSDRPQGGGAQVVSIRPKPPSSTDLRTTNEQRQAALVKMLDDRAQRIAAEEAAQRKKVEDDKDREARCASAKSQFYAAASGRPQYHFDDAGNRVYYTALEPDAKRQTAQSQMVQVCANPER